MRKCSIKKGDTVKIITGNDKGKEAEVLRVLLKKDCVVVSGCNTAKKAVKPSEKNKNGGFETKEMPIHISNVVKVER